MPRWFMEIKEINDELIELDLQSNQDRHADFLGINPFEDGSPLRLFESGSVRLHLAETYSCGLMCMIRSLQS